MSHIFDALQRSEAERSGVELDAFDVPAELLQIAESSIAPAMEDSVDPQAKATARPQTPSAVINTAHKDVESPVAPLDELDQQLPVSLLPQSRLVSVTKKDSLAAEKFRFLAVRLRHLQQRRSLKRLLITSTMPEEGKSMVASNLACALAGRRRQKILLLEGDLRRPTLRGQFGLDRVTGLTEYLQGTTNGSVPVYRLDSVGIWIMPAGGIPADPLELMQAGRLGPLMDRMSGLFDWIIVDSPPVLPLADTSIWARLADGILLVTRPGITDREQLKRGVESLESAKVVGAVVNSSVNVAHSDYQYRYSTPPPEHSDTKNS